jgi:hypothetical protein
VFDAADDAKAIKFALKARFRPGAARAALHDQNDRFICELNVPRG